MKSETAEEILLETRLLRAKTLRTRKWVLNIQFAIICVALAYLISFLVNKCDISLPLAALIATTLATFGGAETMRLKLRLALEVKQARVEGVPIEDP